MSHWAFTHVSTLSYEGEIHMIQRDKGEYWWLTMTLRTSLMHNKKGRLEQTHSAWRLNRGAKGLTVGYSYSTLRNTMTTLITMPLICERTAEIPGRLATLPPLTSSGGSLLHILLGSNQWWLGQKSTREDVFTFSPTVSGFFWDVSTCRKNNGCYFWGRGKLIQSIVDTLSVLRKRYVI